MQFSRHQVSPSGREGAEKTMQEHKDEYPHRCAVRKWIIHAVREPNGNRLGVESLNP